jgi:DnaJ like chaperone protein
MTIWARIMEAIGALAKGEPLSAVFERLTTPPERSVGFTIAVIALGAKMAKADGQVTRDEIAAFRRVFLIPKEEEASAARIYNMARTEVAGFDSYAAQVARMFRGRPKVLGDLL